MFFLLFYKTYDAFRDLIIHNSLNKSLCNWCLRFSEYIQYTSCLDYLTFLHDCYFITDHLNHLHLMCDQKDCNPHLTINLLKQFQNCLCCLWIQGTGCLITKQDIRCCCQCSCNSASLFLSTGKLADIHVFLVFQFYKLKNFFDFLVNLSLRYFLKNQRQCYIMINCFGFQKVELLEYHSNFSS